MNIVQSWQHYTLSIVICVAVIILIFANQQLLQAKEIGKDNKTLNALLLVSYVLVSIFAAFLLLLFTSEVDPVHYFLVISACLTAVFIRLAAKSNHEQAINLTKSEALEHYYATHDDLTGLSNLTFFNEQLDKILSVSRRGDDEFALLIIGLNRFKVINETLGYFVGDAILLEIANRIRASLRKTDLIARLGGDEFAVLINPVSDQEHIQTIAKNIVESVQKPLAVEDLPTDIGVSVGIAIFPKHAQNSIHLIEKARNSLIAAEKSGVSIIVYDAKASDDHLEDIHIIGMLQRAIQEEQLTVLYQPQVRLHDKKVISVEALIRWQHPSYGLLDPARFIPYAEKAGLIYEINIWLLKNVSNLLIEWNKQNIHIAIAINITAHGFLNNDFQQELNFQLQQHVWLSKRLKIELTETSNIEKVTEIHASMIKYKKLGLLFSLDDYGTKHASLEYLKKLPFDELKIDQSFMINAATDEDSRAIIRHAKEISQQLRLTTTAEGIETEEVLKIAIASGIDTGQGYYFSSAIEADELQNYL
ncbi:MAG: putative bifunctional diguanylate cyclase/phosphodiesterase [Gammaproteobacteria bacterium]